MNSPKAAAVMPTGLPNFNPVPPAPMLSAAVSRDEHPPAPTRVRSAPSGVAAKRQLQPAARFGATK